LARDNGTSLFTSLLAAFQVLLYRYTEQEDVLVGSPTAGRDGAAWANLLGYCVNPVVVRSHLTGRASFISFLAEANRTVADAVRHQAFPFPLLVERLHTHRDAGQSPLFQTMFVLQQALARGALGDPIVVDPVGAQFDLTLTATETNDGLDLAFQ